MRDTSERSKEKDGRWDRSEEEESARQEKIPNRGFLEIESLSSEVEHEQRTEAEDTGVSRSVHVEPSSVPRLRSRRETLVVSLCDRQESPANEESQLVVVNNDRR